MESIRLHRPEDIGWIISSHGSVYADEFGFNSEFEVDIARKAVSLCENADATTRIWIKEVAGERAGSIAISKADEEVAFINFLLVLKRFRGEGIARELMRLALHHAQSGGFERVRLETYSCLRSARKMYAGLGFRIVDPVSSVTKYGRRFDREFWEKQLPLQGEDRR